MSRYKDRSGESVKCEDCIHNDKQWYELPCDACCPAHSGYEPISPMELQSPQRRKRGQKNEQIYRR